MSRIGKKPIEIPDKVEVKINGKEIRVKGPKGELIEFLPDQLEALVEENQIRIALRQRTKNSPAFWGLFRSLIFNMIKGVSEGFEKKLEINGVGYRAFLEGEKLVLNIGFSHPIDIEIPEGVELKVEKNIITVSGIDKQLIGQVAAKIRSRKKPEPYKGKGIKYIDEVIRRKTGKKAAGTE